MNRFKIRKVTDVSKKWRNIIPVLFSRKYLLYTNVGISVTLSSTGDAIQQHYEILTNDHFRQSYEIRRSVNMGLSGFTVGVVCHYWYQFLDTKLTGKSIKTVLKKVLVDQIICSPACILTFFLTISILEKMSLYTFLRELREKSTQLYLAEWIVWPPAQLVNFYYLPTRFRVLYDNCISLGFDVYTSKVKHKKSILIDK